MRPERVFHYAVDRFRQDPVSVRLATWLIIVATVLAVVAGGVVVRLFDHAEYPSMGRALWFTLQTVTTVGYGDVTPTSVVGRFVSGIVMLTAIAFITIVTASITSTFVEAARRRAARTEEAEVESTDRTADALEEIRERVGRIEEALRLLARDSRSG